MEVVCPECGNEYDSIGHHWTWNEHHRPELTNKEMEIFTGMMMGDGTLHRSGNNPHLVISSITKEYLEYVDEIMGVKTTGVKQFDSKSADKNARSIEKSFGKSAENVSCSDIYVLSTRKFPELQKLDWYTGNNGEKVWPNNIDLTPTVLKHWYANDGTYNKDNNFLNIAASNERGNYKKVKEMFERASLPSPQYNESENDYSGWIVSFYFTGDDTKEIFDYMGDPLPGFEYKWRNIVS